MEFDSGKKYCISRQQTLQLPVIEDEQTIAALMEANELLGEDNARLRNTNNVLRTVNKTLRETLTVLRKANETAIANDEAFKNFCAEPVLTSITD